MLRIGFKDKYYTLWSVSEPYKHYLPHTKGFVMRVDVKYIRNLSMDKEGAFAKAKEFGVTNFDIDESLKGKGSYSINVSDDRPKQPEWEYPQTFSHPYGVGDIRKMGGFESDLQLNEIKALWCLYLEHTNGGVYKSWLRPMVYARRRLNELGLIERFEGQYLSVKRIEQIKRKRLEVNGHFHKDKERVELMLCKTFKKQIETQFGISYLVRFVDESNRVYTYLGSSSFHFDIDDNYEDGDFVRIKATISHDEYNGEKQTKIKRPKLC